MLSSAWVVPCERCNDRISIPVHLIGEHLHRLPGRTSISGTAGLGGCCAVPDHGFLAVGKTT